MRSLFRALALTACLVAGISSPVSAAFAVINKVSTASSDGNGFTTGSVNMTGADLVICSLAFLHGAEPTLTSSPSNTWRTGIAVQTFGDDVAFHLLYAWNASVNSSMTFTTTGSSTFSSVSCAGFSGSQTSSDPLDQNTGNFDGNAGDTSIMTGSITPTTANQLVATGLGVGSSTVSPGPTADSGFTNYISQGGVSGFAYGSAFSYLIQTSATAENVTWSWTGGDESGTSIASFKAAAGGGGGTPPRLPLIGVGP